MNTEQELLRLRTIGGSIRELYGWDDHLSCPPAAAEVLSRPPVAAAAEAAVAETTLRVGAAAAAAAATVRSRVRAGAAEMGAGAPAGASAAAGRRRGNDLGPTDELLVAGSRRPACLDGVPLFVGTLYPGAPLHLTASPCWDSLPRRSFSPCRFPFSLSLFFVAPPIALFQEVGN